jgi:hypothetical protein
MQCTPPLLKNLNQYQVVKDPPICEDLDLKPIHFKVSGNSMSHGLSNHATPTIINSPTTPTIPNNQNSTTHWNGLPLPLPYYTSSGQCSV